MRNLALGANAIAPVFNGGELSIPLLQMHCEASGIRLPISYDEMGRIWIQSAQPAFARRVAENAGLWSILQTTRALDAIENLSRMRFDQSSGRHLYEIEPFHGCKSGKPVYRGFLLSQHRFLRQLVVPESTDHVLLTVDGRAIDMVMAAVQSGDEKMLAICAAADPHEAFETVMLDLVGDPKLEWLRHKRSAFKRLNLAILNGAGEVGVAEILGVSLRVARRILFRHRGYFVRYWMWVEETLKRATPSRFMRSPMGFTCFVDGASSPHTWQSWPIQAASADVCRMGLLYLAAIHIPVVAAHFDAFIFSVPRSSVGDLVPRILNALGEAERKVLSTQILRWTVRTDEDRLSDGAEDPAWQLILKHVGAV